MPFSLPFPALLPFFYVMIDEAEMFLFLDSFPVRLFTEVIRFLVFCCSFFFIRLMFSAPSKLWFHGAVWRLAVSFLFFSRQNRKLRCTIRRPADVLFSISLTRFCFDVRTRMNFSLILQFDLSLGAEWTEFIGFLVSFKLSLSFCLRSYAFVTDYWWMCGSFWNICSLGQVPFLLIILFFIFLIIYSAWTAINDLRSSHCRLRISFL